MALILFCGTVFFWEKDVDIIHSSSGTIYASCYGVEIFYGTTKIVSPIKKVSVNSVSGFTARETLRETYV